MIDQQIQTILSDIEAEHNVVIPFACEAGSRAWGFESTDSDYDVRFIYVRPVREYLRLDTPRDVIERPDPVIDVSGWDIKKTLTLFRSGNPSLMEWLHSPIIYREDKEEMTIGIPLRIFAKHYFQTRASMHHYLHMCSRNWKAYLQEEPIWTKKYLYVLRAVLACAWIDTHAEVPPVLFKTLWTSVQDITDDRYDTPFRRDLKTAIAELLERKALGDELGRGPRVPVIHDFLQRELDVFNDRVKDIPKLSRDTYQTLTKRLDMNFRRLLLKRSGII